jgi:hypothetical protein
MEKVGLHGIEINSTGREDQTNINIAHLHGCIDAMIKFLPIVQHLDTIQNDDGSIMYSYKSFNITNLSDIDIFLAKFA